MLTTSILIEISNTYNTCVPFQVVPVLVANLPVKQDKEEIPTIYNCLLQLLQAAEPNVSFLLNVYIQYVNYNTVDHQPVTQATSSICQWSVNCKTWNKYAYNNLRPAEQKPTRFSNWLLSLIIGNTFGIVSSKIYTACIGK